ncbi:MAG: hypothetical protein L0G70_08490, partial [Rubrobacter sp.]|nr:hypothetical protein [Rubrobacter sp.]
MSETTPTYSQAEIKHPIVSIVGFLELTAGRAVTAGGAIVAFYLMCIYVSPLVGLEGYMWAILSPFAAFTVLVAVLKPGGHYLEWWILRKIENLFRPSVLLFRRREADNPLKKVRDSVQDALPIEDIEWNWIKAEDGTRLIVFRVEPYAVSLASEQEMRKLWDAAKAYYRRLDFPVIEFKRQRPGSLERYGRRYEEAAAAEIEATEDIASRDALAAFAGAHLSFAAELPLHHELRDLTAYLIIPYNPFEAQAGTTASYDPRGLLSALSKKPTTFETSREQSMDEDAFRTISGRAQVVYEGLSAMGCRATPLSENELLAFFASLSTDCEEDPDDPPRPDEPIMLDAGGYADLSEERVAENARRAEKIRENSPPAVGTATLGIKEAVSPDAVVREPDRLKVGGRHRKTRYIDRWCEDAHFGLLNCLQAVNGRISTLTYIWPRSDEEAEELFGTRLAEMDASLDSDKYGDQRSLSHKQNTRYAAQLANDEITNKRQGYVRVSVLFHMEADTEADLDALDAAVERALRGRSIESRLAREEAWEGYLSSLALGEMRLRASTDRSMLTNALACTFSYTTPYLQHDDGILVGVEASGSALIYNDWKLSSPNSVTLGPPDSGKTFWAKADMTRKHGRGRRIVVLDPAANSYYGRVARRLGGEYAFLRNRSPHKVNPFDIG